MLQQSGRFSCCQLDAFFHARRLMAPLPKNLRLFHSSSVPHAGREREFQSPSREARGHAQKQRYSHYPYGEYHLSNVSALTHHLTSLRGIFSRASFVVLLSTFQSPHCLHVNNSAYDRRCVKLYPLSSIPIVNR